MKNYSKNDFAYVVSSITGFTDEVGGALLTKALVGATTVKEITQRIGVKGSQSLNLLDSSPAFQAGSCGWTSSGTTTYTQRNLTVCAEKVNMEWCSKDLHDTYLSMFLNPGQIAENEAAPFENYIADNLVQQIQQRVETKIWTATTAGGDCFDGLKTLIASGQTGVGVSVSGTAFNPAIAYGTNGNPVWEIDKLINALDSNVQALDDLKVFLSFGQFRKYVQSLTALNYFQNYIGATKTIGDMANAYAIHPNTNVKVVPTIGITDNYVAILPARYTFFGTDLLSDSEKIDVFYSRDNDVLRGRSNYTYGSQIAKFGSTAYFAVNGL
jgi:predicted DNA-binding ArsR family transcriptional regulator